MTTILITGAARGIALREHAATALFLLLERKESGEGAGTAGFDMSVPLSCADNTVAAALRAASRPRIKSGDTVRVVAA